MAGKWVLTVDCMRICLFNDSVLFLIVNGGFQHFSVIVLQKFISIKLSVLYYPQYSPSFRWFCSGALLGFSRCFTRFFRFARSVQFDGHQTFVQQNQKGEVKSVSRAFAVGGDSGQLNGN
jgi:hypothetical protein